MYFEDSFDKEIHVRKMFGQIARGYDRVNTIISFGQDRAWRRLAAKKTVTRGGQRILDCCCGTGKITVELASLVGAAGEVVGVDFCDAMLGCAAHNVAGLENVRLLNADALRLPFRNAFFDSAVMGFALRNLGDLERAISELRRVVGPGGRVVILEINRPTLPVFRTLFHVYFQWAVPAVGAVANGFKGSYSYLPASFTFLPEPEEILGMMEAKGIVRVEFRPLTWGTAGLYWGDVY